MAERSIVAVSAGLSQPSATRLLADRLAAATERALRARDIEPQTDVIELRDIAHELTDHVLTGFPGPTVRAALDRVLAADGVIAVSPIYSGSYNALFKMFFDVIDRDGLSGTPVLIGATGGTARHSLALEHAIRPLFAYLNAAVVPTAVFAAPEDWAASADDSAVPLVDRIGRAGTELARAIAVAEVRPRERRRDPFADPVAFEDLLSSAGAVPPRPPTP